eukprot:9481591-Pyramimonas_sp.AAC.1
MAEKSDTRKRIPAKASGSSSKKCKSFAKGADEDEAFKVEWEPVRERKSRASTRKCGLCRSINKDTCGLKSLGIPEPPSPVVCTGRCLDSGSALKAADTPLGPVAASS